MTPDLRATHRALTPVERPNGKTYRPRKIRVQCWENDDRSPTDGPHYPAGVVVLGTHDVVAGLALANEWCRYWHGSERAAYLATGWYRLGYEGRTGDQSWIDDPERGRAGLMFAATDAPPAEVPC